MRSRVYEFPVKAQMFNCHRQITERQFCNAKINECTDSEAFNSRCTLTGWSAWTDCTVECGLGVRKRERQFKDTNGAESGCKAELLTASEQCVGDNGPDCSVKPNPLCQTTKWSVSEVKIVLKSILLWILNRNGVPVARPVTMEFVFALDYSFMRNTSTTARM